MTSTNHREPPERALVGYRLTYVDLDDLADGRGSRDLETAARQRQRHNFRAESVPVVFDQAVGERSPLRVCIREADQPQARDLAALEPFNRPCKQLDEVDIGHQHPMLRLGAPLKRYGERRSGRWRESPGWPSSSAASFSSRSRSVRT